MSAISVILLVATGSAAALSAAALHTARGLRTELAALRGELSGRTVPAARQVPSEEIRGAVAEALADERERELAEARAYWAEQEAREHEGPGTLLSGRGLGYEVTGGDEELLDALLERYLLSDSGFPGGTAAREQGPVERNGRERPPRQLGEPSGKPPGGREDQGDAAGEEGETEDEPDGIAGGESAELAAARRRHPSHPGYTLSGEPYEPGAGRRRDSRPGQRSTADRLSRLAEDRTPLADVRHGPLGTLDIFLFADGTTLCLSPGHQEAADRLAAALRSGECPVLMGGSGVSGAYALTFSCGRDSIYLLADRVVASSYLSE